MATRANDPAANTHAPILPTKTFPKYLSKPKTAKLKANKPLANNPKSKMGPVIPAIIPKSLSALLVQLNPFSNATAVKMHAKPIIGESIPDDAPIFCQVNVLFLDNVFSSNCIGGDIP